MSIFLPQMTNMEGKCGLKYFLLTELNKYKQISKP